MLFSTIHQGLLFLWMMAAGVGIGAWYALTLGLRRLIRAGFWLTLACDLLFGAGCAVILSAALVVGNYGALLCLFALAPPLRSLGRLLGRGFKCIAAWLRENRLIKIILK